MNKLIELLTKKVLFERGKVNVQKTKIYLHIDKYRSQGVTVGIDLVIITFGKNVLLIRKLKKN